MPASILVATPHIAFGELLRLSLEENGAYQVTLVQSGKEAEAASKNLFSLAVLDAELADVPFRPLVEKVLSASPISRLILIPPENNRQHPSLAGLHPDGYISRPFLLPDVIQLVQELLSAGPREAPQPEEAPREPDIVIEESPAFAGQEPEDLPWLNGTGVLSGRLEEMLPGTQAQAALVIVGERLLAFAGKLAPSSIYELTALLARTWNPQKKSDLARFVHLEAEQAEYLLYATALGDSRVAGLVFNRTESLTQARLQVTQFSRTLSASPVKITEPVASPVVEVEFETVPAPEFEKAAGEPLAEEEQIPSPEVQSWVENLEVEKLEEAGPVVEIPARAKSRMVTGRLQRFTGPSETGAPSLLDRILHAGSKDQAVEKPEEQPEPAQNESEEEEAGSVSLDDLLSQESRITPEVIPGVRPEWIEEIANTPSVTEEAQEEEWQRVLNHIEPEDHSHEAPTLRLVLRQPPATGEEQSVSELPGEVLPNIFETSASQPLFPMSIELEEEEFEPSDPLSETNPHVFTDPSTPPDAGLPGSVLLNNQIFYTFLLVPALPRNYLTGELAEQLGFWLPQLCEGFGWNLQGLAVRPEYLLWTMQLERSVSPASMARIIRQQTSQRVLSIFAELKEQVARDDFWAPGCLIIRGSQSPSPQLLKDFVRQTRRRQQMLTSLRDNDLPS